MKKFELTEEFVETFSGTKLFRIKALIDFSDVKAGDLGGYLEKEENLSQDDNAWISDNAWVYGNARVSNNAETSGNARISGNADYTIIKGFGTEFRTTTFFRCKDGVICVNCGCFHGTIDEFRSQVKRTRTGKIEEEYLIIADLMKKHFKKD